MNLKQKAIKESTKIIYHAKVTCPIESKVEEDVIVGTKKEAEELIKDFIEEYETEYYEFDISAGTPTLSIYREVWIFGDPA